MSKQVLNVMVLAGGPDRERPISFMSGTQVTESLRQAGHNVRQRDILPQDLSALEEFRIWGGDVVFPVLHGCWGEGGELATILDAHGIRYVGCGTAAANLTMDKHRAKLAMVAHGLPTPPFELVVPGERRTIEPPLVFKAPREGSSIDTVICHDSQQARQARACLGQRHAQLLVEQYIPGYELTIGTLAESERVVALPPIQIIPATPFYDYNAKYIRDDTRYLFDIDLPTNVLQQVCDLALRTHRALSCRHMGRIDFIVDKQHRPWILEINTIPGFTTHSLLPMAAAKAGIPMPQLVDRLVRLAAGNSEKKRVQFCGDADAAQPRQ